MRRKEHEEEQAQCSITKQEQVQKISNITMCHTLSAAESLTYRICKENNMLEEFFEDNYKIKKPKKNKDDKLIFQEYDSYDAGSKKSIKDLLIQFIFLVENFKGDYFNYVSKYGNGKYDYPDNLDGQDVISLLLSWNDKLKKIEFNKGHFSEYGCSKYLDNFISLLSNKGIIDYSGDIFKLECNNPNLGKINPKVLSQEYLRAQHKLEKEISGDPASQNVVLYGQNSLTMNNSNITNTNLEPYY